MAALLDSAAGATGNHRVADRRGLVATQRQIDGDQRRRVDSQSQSAFTDFHSQKVAIHGGEAVLARRNFFLTQEFS